MTLGCRGICGLQKDFTELTVAVPILAVRGGLLDSWDKV